MSDGNAQDPPEVLIDPKWRVVLVALGVALLIGASLAWWKPPTKIEFAPQAATAGSDTTANVEDRSETTTGLLLGLAVLCIVIAANGRKLTSVKIAGQEISTAVTQAADTAKDIAEARALAAGLDADAARQAATLAEAQIYAAALPGTPFDLGDLNLDAVAESAVQATKLTVASTDASGTQ